MKNEVLKFQLALNTPFGKRSIRSTRKAVYTMAVEFGFSDDACREIELCMSEALQNAMEHGSGQEGRVNVNCAFSSNGLQIVIEDPGAGEGDLKVLKAAFEAEIEQIPDLDNERGRGIYLIRTLMDSSKMEPRENGGVRIIMSKNRG